MLNKISTDIENVLYAREKRSSLRNEIATSGNSNISLTLNIPGYPKSNEIVTSFFETTLSSLKIFLSANRISIKDEINIIDGAGNFFLAKIDVSNSDLKSIKNLTESFEERHELGRLIDVDIFDTNNLPISSGKHKSCFICEDKSALECMREQTHTFKELRTVMFKRINNYCSENKKQEIENTLSEYATKSLLYEVSLTPKPGLVDFENCGSHNDMDFQVFLNSTAALSSFWEEFAVLGINFKKDLKYALPEIREIGLRAEIAMFQSTNGVNTQKGLIFLLGLSVFSSAYILQNNGRVSEKNLQKTIKTISCNLIENELDKNTTSTTHGTEVFKKYGLKGAGARYQAQFGFPVVFDKVLPFLLINLNDKTLLNKTKTDKVLKSALVIIIKNLDDTNVMYRKGIKIAEELKAFADDVIKGKKSYSGLCNYCIDKNISPGGAADMLAISFFTYSVITRYN